MRILIVILSLDLKYISLVNFAFMSHFHKVRVFSNLNCIPYLQSFTFQLILIQVEKTILVLPIFDDFRI